MYFLPACSIERKAKEREAKKNGNSTAGAPGLRTTSKAQEGEAPKRQTSTTRARRKAKRGPFSWQFIASFDELLLHPISCFFIHGFINSQYHSILKHVHY